jgi:zinc-finger of transposase IS204/IS1001/IS1096/IS1165
MSYLAALLAISIRYWYAFLVPEEEMEEHQHAMAKPTLLPDPTCLHLKLLDASETVITAVVTTTSEEATCPLCHQRSTRIHSRYERAVADLPWMGCAVHLELHVRRFFCSNSECVRQIFTERVPTAVERRAIGMLAAIPAPADASSSPLRQRP